MGMKKNKGVTIQGMPYDEWKDNEYIESLVEELKANGTNVVVGFFDKLINWGRANSLWPLTFGTSCCAIEFIALGAARYDMARFGWAPSLTAWLLSFAAFTTKWLSRNM